MVQALDDARRRRPVANRVPPHNLQAEESLLGAMLLSRDAIAVAVEASSAEDFYKPAHGHVYEAITSLYARGEPADPVTVADELRRAGLLEAVGGPALLVSLQASTPATSNAGRYARIVQEHALLRRLIGVAGEIAEMGYDVPDDVEATVDRAEALVYEIAQRRVSDTMAPLRDLLSASLDRLEALYDRGEAITGTPTGFLDLDERLAGLQPSNLLIVGARPSMGKCVAASTPLLDPRTGAVRTVADLCRRDRADRDVEVVSLASDHRLRLRRPSAAVDDGVRPVFRTTTRSGREIQTTLSHPFLTPTGWRPLVDLCRGQKIGVPSALPFFGTDALPEAQVVLLAHRVGQGDLPSVPEEVFRLPRAQLALFLDRLLGLTAAVPTEGSGRVTWRPPTGRVASGVQHLLLRFGLNARVRRRYVKSADASHLTHVLELTRPDELFRFADEMRVFATDDGSAELGEVSRRGSVGRRTSPGAVGRATEPGSVMTEERAADTGDPGGTSRDGTSRDGTSDGDGCGPAVLWDEIVSIEPVGDQQVYDLTVPVDHNFVAGDIFVHNTAFALGMAAHAAMEARVPVLFFSLEMSHLEITQRLLCSEARVDATRMRNGRLQEADWPKISHAIGRLGEAPMFIDDNPNLTVMEVRAKSRRLKSKEGALGLIVVDYLQLMTGRTSAENRQVEVSEISRGLKILARELETPVLALSQLSRGLEARADKRPGLADLRESGSLEQDADVVMFLYRDEVYNPDSPDRGTAEIIVAKHRNGPTGVTQLAFLDHYTRFANMARGV